MSLLLLSCCAPCAIGVVERLKNEKKDFSIYFYNPNIQPEDEFDRRAMEMKKVCDYFDVKFILEPYQAELWKEKCGSLMDLPERGLRCAYCFELRLKKSFQYALEHGYDSVSSVLGFSRYKDFSQVNQCAKNVQIAGITYDETNWRKGGIQLRTQELIVQLDIYHQSYCGCKIR